MNKYLTVNVPPFLICLHQTREQKWAHLSYKNPPKCVFKMEKAINLVFHEMGSRGLDKIDIWFKGCMGVIKGATV